MCSHRVQLCAVVANLELTLGQNTILLRTNRTRSSCWWALFDQPAHTDELELRSPGDRTLRPVTRDFAYRRLFDADKAIIFLAGMPADQPRVRRELRSVRSVNRPGRCRE
jgi:hypothetical protein